MISKLCLVVLILFAYYCAFLGGYHFAIWRIEKVVDRNAKKEENNDEGDSDR